MLLEAELPLPGRMAAVPLRKASWWLLLAASKGKRLDTAYVCPRKDAKSAFAKLKVGAWTPKCFARIHTAKGTKEAAFKLRLNALSADGATVKLYATPLCQTTGWATPKAVCKQLRDLPGLPLPNSFYASHNLGWNDSRQD